MKLKTNGRTEVTELFFRHVKTDSKTGTRRWELSKEAEQVLKSWHADQGQTLEQWIWGFRRSASGHVLFSSGSEETFLDESVFGGDGSGEAHKRFEMETGCRLVRFEGRRTKQQMDQW